MGWGNVVQIYHLCNHRKGEPTSGLKKEEDKEKIGCWAPPLQYDVPHGLQELGKKRNNEVHRTENYEPSVETLLSRSQSSQTVQEL